MKLLMVIVGFIVLCVFQSATSDTLSKTRDCVDRTSRILISNLEKLKRQAARQVNVLVSRVNNDIKKSIVKTKQPRKITECCYNSTRSQLDAMNEILLETLGLCMNSSLANFNQVLSNVNTAIRGENQAAAVEASWRRQSCDKSRLCSSSRKKDVTKKFKNDVQFSVKRALFNAERSARICVRTPVSIAFTEVLSIQQQVAICIKSSHSHCAN